MNKSDLPESGESLADTLKGGTREQHTRAERHSLMGRMISGTITPDQYAAYLRQMWHVQHALETGLQSRMAEPAFAVLVRPYHFHADRVKADLAALHAATDGPLLVGTANFVSLIARGAADMRPWLLGVWYVLEGSTNGGRFIAKALARVFGPGVAVSSIDPHGELTRERWQAWRAGLDSLTLSGSDREAIIDAAKQTFDAIYDLLDDVERATVSPHLTVATAVGEPHSASARK